MAATAGIAQAATNPAIPIERIDAFTHFAPLKFLDFAAAQGGPRSPAASRELYTRKPPLVDVHERLRLLDRNEVNIHVLIPLPWLECFPRIADDRELAPRAARLMNDELASVVASNPQRFRGVALLPAVNAEAAVAELHRAVERTGICRRIPCGRADRQSPGPPRFRAFVQSFRRARCDAVATSVPAAHGA